MTDHQSPALRNWYWKRLSRHWRNRDTFSPSSNLYVLQGPPSEEDAYDEEEREGEAQLLIIQTLQLQLHNHLKAIDISRKAKRVQKLRMFVESDSLADRDMEAKLSAMEPLINELLDAATELPDLDELTELIGQVHLTYRKFMKYVLRATLVKDSDPTTSHPDTRKQPPYRLPKMDMPTFEGDPKLWRRFWERFSQRLSMHPDLPASEKIAQLEQAIEPPAGRALISALPAGRALISAPEGVEEEYLASVAALNQRYDQPHKIYRTHVYAAYELSTPKTRNGLYVLATTAQDIMNGIGGMDADSVIVAALERGLHKDTMSDWTAHLANTGKDPTMKTFLAFILKKAAELDEEDTPCRIPATSSIQPYTAPPRTYNPGRKPPRETVLYSREQGSCKHCNDANHVLFQCPELKS